jgi:hypothetical protein
MRAQPEISGELESGAGRTRLRIGWRLRGADLCVHVGGGADHVGAVALVGQGPDGQPVEHSVRLPPHREEELALKAARTLHQATGRTVCVTAGVHLDDITPQEIEQVLQIADNGIRQLAGVLARQLSSRKD